MKITNRLARMWVDGNLKGGLLMLNTSKACWIPWSIVMSPRGRTNADETWRLFRTCAGTPDESWSANKRWCVTCRSEFWGSTDMFRGFPDLLLRLCLLPQQQRGGQVLDDELWKHSDRYIRWFYRVSHPFIVNPAPEPDNVMPRPVYQDILVDQ